MSEWERDGSPMPSGPPPVTFGKLTLMKRKGGGDVQTIPLDAERITFGRDYDCDVRLYYSDVSKLHCEIIFDAVSGKAVLHVKGTNGLLHKANEGSPITYKPPTDISLSDGDIITIRKKPFRFEYGGSSESPIPFSPAVQTTKLHAMAPSPAKQPASGSPKGHPIRRRASHRLSLVPEGKTFVPLSPIKNRRASSLGLGGMGTPAKLNGKSKLSEEVPQEQDEEIEESVLDIADGDEGDMVYLEVNEEEGETVIENANIAIKPVHENAFMTPQPARKAALRNTSAVARTRKQTGNQTIQPADPETTSTSPVSKDTPTPATPPKTPRSVPLPMPADTPYNPPSTPSAEKASSTPIPARVAMSTPKGPATLRKALLLRSARKVWQESRASGVEGAIESGDVEIRRKSISPKNKAGRRSINPISESPIIRHDPENGEDTSEDPEAAQQEQLANDGEPKWIQEDGTAEVSFESNSSGDSLEADISLDIPGGQGVNQFSPVDPNAEEEYMNNDLYLEGEEDKDQDEGEEMEDIEEEAQGEGQYEEYEEAVNLPADISVEDIHSEELPHEDEGEADQDETMSLPGTPHPRRPLSATFFTPQTQRHILKQPRRSLAGIGGPPVRFERLPATPNSLRPTPAPLGSMGKPSRRVVLSASDQPKEQEEHVAEKKVFMTPVKSEAARAEAKRRRESLATPRQLPAPPASGFKNPVMETRLSDLMSTPSHPALAPTSPEAEMAEQSDQARVVPGTPMDDLKHRLNKMRQQSTKKADRRFTVGFALPSTPSRHELPQTNSWSVNPRRIEGKGPKTPIFPKIRKEDPIAESPSGSTSRLEDNETAEEIEIKLPSSPEYETPSSPSTPLYTVSREMLQPNLPAKTPDLSGLRTLFPATPKQQASPSLAGVREMMRQPIIPSTPNFIGMRDMFQVPKVAQTPEFEGVGEMFEEEQEDLDQTEDVIVVTMEETEQEKAEEAEQEEEEEDEEEEEVEQVEIRRPRKIERPVEVKPITSKPEAESKLPRPTASTSSSTSTASRARGIVSTQKEDDSVATFATIPAKAAASATSKIPARKMTATKVVRSLTLEMKPKPSRSRKAAEVTESEESTSKPTRAKRTASVDPEPASAPSRATTSRSRSTRARTTAEPEEQPQPISEPVKTTRNKSTSSRAVRKVAEEETEKEISKPSRSKRPLAQLPEQIIEEEKVHSTSSRGKKSTTSTSKTTEASSKDKVSAPSRKKVANKENDETVEEEQEKPKKRIVAASNKKEESKSGVPVAVSRATRSRK
ncbi:uncharacterized protein IL334_000525 [Kwoniella shivajii]|uniref:FHA domain-containing protein n=1 Tax=Kwoniella shivajii TaxID=564305 RepID=A0ABZ1CQE7_9TREE|nr:hypothetical protein IL334_000525 [Kwoniella shivajii]